MKRGMAIGIMVAAAAWGLGIGEAKADPEYDACIAESRESEFAACGVDWVEREDRLLNAVWRDLIPRLEERERAALVAEQRAWIAFNDQSCDYFYTDYWGTVGRNNWYPRCRADIIMARTAQLRAIRERIDEQGE